MGIEGAGYNVAPLVAVNVRNHVSSGVWGNIADNSRRGAWNTVVRAVKGPLQDIVQDSVRANLRNAVENAI